VLRQAGSIRHGFWANMIVTPFISVSFISLSSLAICDLQSQFYGMEDYEY